jgi:hypothetical protein
VASGFTQREPNQGEPATERTEFRVVYSPTTFYLGIRALDANPDRIIAGEMGRDVSLFKDDSVIVILDTFHDHRNAFFFETNPNSSRTDALITDEGRDTNFEWDGVWWARAQRTPDGWTAEIAIPFSTLRFDPRLDTWGINVRRLIRHKNEEVFWAPINRDASLFRISLAGHLTDLSQIPPASLNLRVKPFVVGEAQRSIFEPLFTDEDDIRGGLDARWGLTQSLTLDLTYKTDFAQVEVDDQQVNLTRFSLFFPEKREFFLENAGLFEFSDAGSKGFDSPPLLKTFFSRRIGIGPDGETVPVLAGARLTGRVGDWSLGVMDVQTEELVTPGTIIPSDNWGVFRLKRNVGARSTVGTIFTQRLTEGGDYNRVYGFDADINPTRELKLSGFWSQSRDPGVEGESWAAGAAASYKGEIWEWGFDFLEIRKNHNPEMGFLLRRGIRRFLPDVIVRPRPDWPGVRNLFLRARAEIITRTDGTLETFTGSTEYFGVRFDSEDIIAFYFDPHMERLFVPFEIRPGLVIPEGEYWFQNYGLWLETNRSRKVSGNFQLIEGGFFDGERTTYGGGVQLRPSAHFRTDTLWSHNRIDLPAGSFATNILRQRIDVSFTANLFTNTFIQYNDDIDLLSLNFRLDWIYRPGADLFVIYNQNWNTGGGGLVTSDRQLIVKFTYLFEF